MASCYELQSFTKFLPVACKAKNKSSMEKILKYHFLLFCFVFCPYVNVKNASGCDKTSASWSNHLATVSLTLTSCVFSLSYSGRLVAAPLLHHNLKRVGKGIYCDFQIDWTFFLLEASKMKWTRFQRLHLNLWAHVRPNLVSFHLREDKKKRVRLPGVVCGPATRFVEAVLLSSRGHWEIIFNFMRQQI